MPKSKSNIHFEISERKVLLRIFDIVSVLIGLFLVSNFFEFDYFMMTAQNWYWIIVLVVYLTVFANVFELYNLQKSSKFEIIAKNITITTAVTVLFYLLTPFFTPFLPENRLQILFFFLAILVPLLIWRGCYIFFISRPRFFKNILLIGDQYEIYIMAEAIKETTSTFNIVGYINSNVNEQQGDSFLNDLAEFEGYNLADIVKANAVSEIIVASNESEEMAKNLFEDLIHLLEQGMPIREYTQVYEELTSRVPVQYIGKDFYRYFPFSRSNQNKLYLFFHRLMDIVLSLLGLSVSLLLLPIILVGNLLGNRGPLVYTQQRVGKNGKPFNIFKFRSMVVDAERDGVKWAEEKDPRITKFGRFLRKSRFDEIPQFINVLKGEMSIIGPRPERPEFVRELSKELPFYETRHIVKPGVTGWAQVNSDYGASQEDSLHKLQYDLYYIKHRSFFLDVSIIVKTLSTVLFYRGR